MFVPRRRDMLCQLAGAGLTALVGGPRLLARERPTETRPGEEQPPEPSAEKLFAAARAKLDRDDSEAEQLLTRVVKLDDSIAAAYYFRGRARFRLAKFAASVADFDRYIAAQPQFASRQWERGIACYYAGQFDEGAAQFKLYQTYHNNDVENSVWRFLCMVPKVGVAAARREMLPIRNDRRIPMMVLYDMYRGTASPWDVEAAIVSDDPDPPTIAYRRFYAELYLGLYFLAIGNPKLGRRAILRAADDHRRNPSINRFMWAVARVHAERLREQQPMEGAPS